VDKLGIEQWSVAELTRFVNEGTVPGTEVDGAV